MEEQLASQELARKDEGLKLRVQLHTATQEVREVQIKVSAMVRKLVTAQQGVTSKRASMGRKRMEILKLEAEGTRKREELRALELDELKWMGVQDSRFRIAMDLARSEAQVVDNQEGLEETRSTL